MAKNTRSNVISLPVLIQALTLAFSAGSQAGEVVQRVVEGALPPHGACSDFECWKDQMNDSLAEVSKISGCSNGSTGAPIEQRLLEAGNCLKDVDPDGLDSDERSRMVGELEKQLELLGVTPSEVNSTIASQYAMLVQWMIDRLV